MCSLKEILKPLVMAEQFCEEQNCSLCMSAIKTAQELVVKNFSSTNSAIDAVSLAEEHGLLYPIASAARQQMFDHAAWLRAKLLPVAHTSASLTCQAVDCTNKAAIHLCDDCFDKVNSVVRLLRQA